MRAKLALLTLGIAVLGMPGCTRTQKGGVIGGTAGAILGGAIGSRSENTAVGALIGAAVGGAAGAYIGRYMDRQAEEISADLEGANVERVGEGIKITFDSGILFDVDKAALRPEAKANLRELARILEKYPDTDILIEGHTDATGSEEHNLTLSRARAQSVANYLAALEVDPTRFTIMGYGESQPVASNDTETGRQKNRRVELAIMANERLKKVARERAG